jgi:hypothetical protein
MKSMKFLTAATMIVAASSAYCKQPNGTACADDSSDYCCDPDCTYCGPIDYCHNISPDRSDSGTCAAGFTGCGQLWEKETAQNPPSPANVGSRSRSSFFENASRKQKSSKSEDDVTTANDVENVSGEHL